MIYYFLAGGLGYVIGLATAVLALFALAAPL